MLLLAYHITWGTYGTRLHGDPRKTVDRQHNQYGEEVLGFDEHCWEREKSLLKFPPVTFTPPQMILIESLIPEICTRGGWIHRICVAGPDHVHTILTSSNDPKTIRSLLKRWLGQSLSERLNRPRPKDATWWAECGSTRWIFQEDGPYYEDAFAYVQRQRATP
jgi:REP element-mobilizing transposase RayT